MPVFDAQMCKCADVQMENRTVGGTFLKKYRHSLILRVKVHAKNVGNTNADFTGSTGGHRSVPFVIPSTAAGAFYPFYGQPKQKVFYQ